MARMSNGGSIKLYEVLRTCSFARTRLGYMACDALSLDLHRHTLKVIIYEVRIASFNCTLSFIEYMYNLTPSFLTLLYCLACNSYTLDI